MNVFSKIIPKPQSIKTNDEYVKIAEFNKYTCNISASADNKAHIEAEKIIKKKLYDTCVSNVPGSYKISLITDGKHSKFKDIKKKEAYFIDISENEAVLCGVDNAGTYYAAITLIQMFVVKNDGIYLPVSHIVDWPFFEKRGCIMESRYGTEFTTLSEWCDFIDYMASMKLNRLTIAVYGCWEIQYDDRKTEYLFVPIKKYPQLKTPKVSKYYSVKKMKWIHKNNILPPMYEDDFFGKIIAYGKSKNVLVKPRINSLGHNTLIPGMFPEISAKSEDGKAKGRGFCTSCDETYRVLFDIYDEIIERYLKPYGVDEIHIGLDEVGEAYICRCEKCKNIKHSDQMIDYIIKLCKHLKGRGIKSVYINHDMLFHEFDIINENLKERFVAEDIYDVAVIDWWSYKDPEYLFNGRVNDVNSVFRSVIKPDTGYYHWAIPTENNENIRACAQLAKKLSFEGIEAYSSLEYCYDKNYLTLADVSWNDTEINNIDMFNERYAFRYYPDKKEQASDIFIKLHNIMKDETKKTYVNRACLKFEYYFHGYRNRDTNLAPNFPGNVYSMISENENEYINYLEYLKVNSAPCVEFFLKSGNTTCINNIWLLTSMHYYTLADEYLTIYSLYKDYNNKKCSASDVIKELERLIYQREKLMALAEDVRIEANLSTYLRNMTVFRQYMTDLKDYIIKELQSANSPKFDIMDLSYAMSEKFYFLR